MIGLYIIFGIIIGAVIAFFLNKFCADKIENKNTKLRIKITAYVVLIILGLLLGFVWSIKPSLNKFIDDRINTIEVTLNRHFPNIKVMEIGITANSFTEIVDQLQKSLEDINVETEGFFQRLVFNAFIDGVNTYIDDAHRGINTFGVTMGNNQEEISLRSILNNLKDFALKKITPFLVIFVVLIIFGFLVFIGIYLGIIKLLRKRA